MSSLFSKSAFCAIVMGCVVISPSARAQDAGKPVTVVENDIGYVLDNGIITAIVSRKSGDLVSMKYKGVEQMAVTTLASGIPDLSVDIPGDPGRGRGMTDHMYGFWSHDTDKAPRTVAAVTIDPKTNNGDRGEVSVKAFSEGTKLGHGPGAPAGGEFAADIDIRYTLNAGESGLYTYCAFDHKPDYPDATLGEARFCVKLNNDYDFMMVDEHHHMKYPMEYERNGDDKYNYTTVQYEHPAFGWASSSKNTGFFFINPSVEYLTGPPTKIEFMCHRDTSPPNYYLCILNYWRSSHYGGGGVDVAKGESWQKVIGPFLLYCNTGPDPDTMWREALAMAVKEKGKWPYEWVKGVDYPHKDERATVSGTMVLSDPLMPETKMTRLLVGLTYPDYHITVQRPSAPNQLADITWQNDSKHYEFWSDGDPATGKFEVRSVRPGKYTLHAIAYGVLGEYTQKEVTVEGGKPLDLGKITWTPVRHGKQLWDIGIPNRSGREFAMGDDYFHDGMAGVYATMFPNDVNYTIGKSDFSRDWFYLQMPHTAPAPHADPADGPVGRGGGGGGGRATPWTINFDLAQAPKGKATLDFGIATANTRQLSIAINDEAVGGFYDLFTDSSVGRNGIQGIWYEREYPFDAAKLKAGANKITLTVPAGGGTAGIIYDYIRLELDENAAAPPPQAPGRAGFGGGAGGGPAAPGRFPGGGRGAPGGAPSPGRGPAGQP